MKNKIPKGWDLFPDSKHPGIVEPESESKPTAIAEPALAEIMNQCKHRGCDCNNGKKRAGRHLHDCWCNYCQRWMVKHGFNRDWSLS